jgi:hypothetical protein
MIQYLFQYLLVGGLVASLWLATGSGFRARRLALTLLAWPLVLLATSVELWREVRRDPW